MAFVPAIVVAGTRPAVLGVAAAIAVGVAKPDGVVERKVERMEDLKAG